jgi:hypothetical protein
MNPQKADSRRTILPGWYIAVGGLLVGLFVLFNVAYRLGAGGIEVSGASSSFDREFDHQLFKIDDRRAFLIFDDNISVVKYAGGLAPFRPVCGTYEPDGSVINLAHFKKGDWVYSKYPEFDGPDAYNLRTEEVVKVDVPDRKGSERVDPATVPFYAEHGFTFDDALLLKPELVAKEHEPLSTMNESCVTFNAAFYLLFALMIVVGIPLAVMGIIRRGRANA